MSSFSRHFAFHPKLIDSLKGYKRTTLIADVLAGITVGIVALPLASLDSLAMEQRMKEIGRTADSPAKAH